MQGVAYGKNRNRKGNTQFPENCGQVSVLQKLWVFLRNERQVTFAYFWNLPKFMTNQNFWGWSCTPQTLSSCTTD